MAIIPLNQKAYVRKFNSGHDDGWNSETYGEPIEYDVRAVEKTEVVTNTLGEEVVASVKITFDKLPDIAYEDEVSYTNELGVTIARTPLSIKPIRMVNGKATLTAVHL